MTRHLLSPDLIRIFFRGATWGFFQQNASYVLSQQRREASLYAEGN